MNRATNVPARWPVTEPVSGVTMVPKPPLYKPALAPDLNVVGAAAKLPRLIPPAAPAAVGNCRRLKMFVNSTRMFKPMHSLILKLRLKLAFSRGMRIPGNERIEL